MSSFCGPHDGVTNIISMSVDYTKNGCSMFASRLGFKGEALSPDIRKKQAEKLRESFVIFPVRLWKLRAHSHEGLSEDEVS